jgi:hypothetical protein
MMFTTLQAIGRGILVADHSADTEGSDFAPIPETYRLYESYYANTMYARSGQYRDTRTGLPVTIRPIHNPVRRVVDWYAGRVTPGAMSEDGLPTAGKPNRIPYADDTDERVRLAVQQAFQWGAVGFDLGLYVRTGAMLGDVFAEVVSDPERQKVYPKLTHPRYLTDVAWNDTGDVTYYQVEIPMVTSEGRPYRWGKMVDKWRITTLLDGKPHGYDGQPATVENLWGFVPAILVQHQNVGTQHGAPAFAGVMNKIDELNGIVSEIDDYILRFTKQHIIIGTDDPGAFNTALTASNATRRGRIDEEITSEDMARRRDGIKVMGAKPPVSVARLIENMGLGEAVPHRDRLLTEIEEDLPEITLSSKLLDMSQVTGPGAVPLVQDVQHKLDEAAANYDAGLIKLGQMCISMAAQCLRDGIWDRRTLTDQQRKFDAFTPDSYDRGELAFNLTPRTLIPESFDQKIAQAAAIERLQTREGLRRIGLDEAAVTAQFNESREAADTEADRASRQFFAGSVAG